MALPTRTLTFDDITSSTTAAYDKTIKDNITKNQAALAFLRKASKPFLGGDYIYEPLMYALATTSTQYTGAQQFNFVEDKNVTTGQYPLAHYSTSMAITKTDLEKNRGAAQVFSLIEARYAGMQGAHEQKLTTDLFGTQTAAPYLIGLGTAVPSSANTYAGINRSVETWHDCQRDTSTALGTLTLGSLQALWGSCSNGSETPTVGITTQAIYNRIWEIADSRQRLGTDKSVSLGFTNIEFNGIPIVVDKSCTAGYFYFLNTKYIYLRESDTDNMNVTDWYQLNDRHAKVKYITWTGQLVCSDSRYQGVFSALT